MFCPNCGAQNAPGARFCSGCGAPLGSAQRQQPQQQYRKPQFQRAARAAAGGAAKKAGGGLLKKLLTAVLVLGVGSAAVSMIGDVLDDDGGGNNESKPSVISNNNNNRNNGGATVTADGVTISMEKEVYAPGETITVRYEGVSATLAANGAWIGMAGHLNAAAEFTGQGFLPEGSGKATMKAPNAPGQYQVRLFKASDATESNLIARLDFTVTNGSVTPPSVDSGTVYYLLQTYEFPVDEKEGEEEFLLYKVEFDSDAGLAYLYDLSIPDDEVFFFEWDGSSLHLPGSEYAENGRMELQIRDDGVISGYATADGETSYWRFSPVAPLGDEWITVETEETFELKKEYRLEDGKSRIDDVFMDEVRTFASAHGSSMTPASKPDEGGGGGNPPQPTNQFTDEQIQYYIQIEGQRHIREFTEWKANPDSFRHADHMQLPANAGITQEEFERRADEYASRNGPSDYVPIETWKD